jgi:hypothetical protein
MALTAMLKDGNVVLLDPANADLTIHSLTSWEGWIDFDYHQAKVVPGRKYRITFSDGRSGDVSVGPMNAPSGQRITMKFSGIGPLQ